MAESALPPLLSAWRLVKPRYAQDPWSGEGARHAGGRWNSQGVLMVYASASRALAALEVLVHLNPPLPHLEFYIAEIQFPAAAVERLAIKDLPEHWREVPPGAWTRAIGDAWVRRQQSPVLAVPSALMPEECNYLFNPRHPEFAGFKTVAARIHSLDPRFSR